MIKTTMAVLALATSFGGGFAFNSLMTGKPHQQLQTRRVTGIGGIFFKCKDPHALKEWYKVHLGLDAGPYGARFDWREAADSTKKGVTQWTPFPEKSKYFDPSPKDFMIDYRVENLEQLVVALKAEGVTVVDNIATADYGKFVHILDLEGNKVELWEP